MKRDDLIIITIGLLLLAGMLYTIFFGGEKSIHGVGNIDKAYPEENRTAHNPLHALKSYSSSCIRIYPEYQKNT